MEVTALGFGAAALGNLYTAITDDTARACLDSALAAGIGYVDTAPHYGQGLSERRVGQVLNGNSDIVISSKIGRVLTPVAPLPAGTERHGFVDGDPFEPHFDYSYDGVMRAFEDSVKRLGRDRIDILLAHDLGTVTHGDEAAGHMKAFLDGGLRAMHELKAQGRVTAIGLGVNEWQVCEDVLANADLDAILLAGRYTLLEQGALDSFLPLCEQRGISVIVGGPFNSGILVDGTHYDYGRIPPEVCGQVTALKKVCMAHDVPLAAAALQFPLAHPAVACVIPGMADTLQVRTNLALFRHDIPSGLWSDLKAEGLLHDSAPVPVLPVLS
ncbi:MAG: aldo/keto reductase [Asticcacaulis sp.]|uniref:aldo/keto reductase n=1 Tax=Asticcacaulis sp. TaxID=1872648 RepID=UPI0039E35092